MNVGVISYSLTGNNEALAAHIASAAGAEHIRITESKKRTNGTIAADILLGRTPKTEPSPELQDQFDLIVYVAPVWMGQAAFPLRAYLKRLKTVPRRYAFVSVRGGSDGENQRMEISLTRLTGKTPEAVVEMLISELLPPDPKPAMAATGAYRLTDEDAKKLSEKVMAQLKSVFALV